MILESTSYSQREEATASLISQLLIIIIFIIIIIIIKNELAVQGWERVRTLYQFEVPTHTTNPLKEEKEKIIGDKKSRLGKQEGIGFALKGTVLVVIIFSSFFLIVIKIRYGIGNNV